MKAGGEIMAIAAYLDSNDGVIYDYILILSVAPAGRSDLTHTVIMQCTVCPVGYVSFQLINLLMTHPTV